MHGYRPPSIADLAAVCVKTKRMPTKQVTPRKNLVAEKTANLKEHIISIEELSKNNTSKSAWVAVDGKVYDVTNWISKHPGGSDVILMAAGRDATQVCSLYIFIYNFLILLAF